MILDEIIDAAAIRIEKAKKSIPLNEMAALAKNSSSPFAFENALKQKDISFICEIKKASPSKGIISNDFPYIRIAREYEEAGAAAVSVLTEPDFFMGSTDYLKDIKRNITIPILQKDFIIDEYQVYEASVIGANAILVICSLLNITEIKKFIKIADSLGLSCLAEAHNEQEVKKAIEAGARVIGVNNRNLKTFEVDINNSVKLRAMVPKDIIFVSEIGIKTAADINILRKIGTDAVLIGETLMRSNNIKAELDILKGRCCD